jgi:hypothetical protein
MKLIAQHKITEPSTYAMVDHYCPKRCLGSRGFFVDGGSVSSGVYEFDCKYCGHTWRMLYVNGRGYPHDRDGALQISDKDE